MRRGRLWVACLVGLCIVMVAGGCVQAPDFGPIAPGEPGADGPCGSERSDLWNPRDLRHGLWVFQPTGEGRPYTGGSCGDSSRPVVLIAHGYVATAPELYQGLIDHLVGNGFVVVFQGYPVQYDVPHQYGLVDTGFVQGVEFSGRADVSRVGVIGHSFGGGMTSWLVQQAAARGWGAAATWAVMFAPHFADQVGDGPIAMPPNARVVVVAYEDDVFVDARVGIEIFESLDLPADQKTHVMLLTDAAGSPTLVADHLGPVSIEAFPFLGVLSTDHYDRWSAWRTVDATAGCSLDGRWCGTDLADEGSWPDGTPVRRALVGDDPVDRGPVALQECEFFLNRRRCPG